MVRLSYIKQSVERKEGKEGRRVKRRKGEMEWRREHYRSLKYIIKT